MKGNTAMKQGLTATMTARYAMTSPNTVRGPREVELPSFCEGSRQKRGKRSKTMSTAIAVSSAKVGRDESCPCGSGRKYKRCCAKDKSKRREREQLYAVVSIPEQKVTDVLKEAEVIDVLLSSENRDKFLAAAKARTPHESQHLSYHEGGHALMEMLFYNDLDEVTIVPSFDAKTRSVINGLCKSIDCEKNKLIVGAAAKMPVEAYLAVQNVIVSLAGSIAERLFCECGWSPDGDTYDRENIHEYYADLEKGVTKDISPLVSEFVQRYRPELDAIANALFERQTLTGAEVRDLLLAGGWKAEDLIVASLDSYWFCEEVFEAWIPDPELKARVREEVSQPDEFQKSELDLPVSVANTDQIHTVNRATRRLNTTKKSKESKVPTWIQNIWDGADKTFTSAEEASTQPKGIVTLFYNDGDIAVGVEQSDFPYYFREEFKASKGEHAGEPISQEDFKKLLPVNHSIAQYMNPAWIPIVVQMVRERRPERAKGS